MARPRKAVSMMKGTITKAERLNREINESKHKVDNDALIPPMWLSYEGKAEFKRVAEEAKRADFLDNLDLSTLAIYADAYAHFIRLSIIIQEQGEVIKTLSANGIEVDKVNPAIMAQSEYVTRIYKASTKLGMATTDRLKLIVPDKTEKKENKFIKLLEA